MTNAPPRPGLHPLAAFRQSRNLTLAMFARLVGTTEGTISRIENGQRLPGIAMLRKIVRATEGGVSYDEIINWQPVRNGEAA